MINQNDVRIGNIIQHSIDIPLHGKFSGKVLIVNTTIIQNLGGMSPEDYQGIKLTPEILECVGFMKNPNERHSYSYYKDNYYVSILGNSIDFGVNIYEDSQDICEIEYLHDLQNIWYLVNGKQELEIDIEKLKQALGNAR